ncbi:MAG: hypothetical protein IH626_00610 [Rhodospirillales bacterium]|nr:hypothetical protein [Rhodospirillales bacterium]
MTDLDRRRRPEPRPASSSQPLFGPTKAPRPAARWPAGDEPTLDEMFADPIFHLLLRRDRLTLPDVLGAIAEARGRLRN